MLLTCLHCCCQLIVTYFLNFLSFCVTGHCLLTLVATQPLHFTAMFSMSVSTLPPQLLLGFPAIDTTCHQSLMPASNTAFTFSPAVYCSCIHHLLPAPWSCQHSCHATFLLFQLPPQLSLLAVLQYNFSQCKCCLHFYFPSCHLLQLLLPHVWLQCSHLSNLNLAGNIAATSAMATFH